MISFLPFVALAFNLVLAAALLFTLATGQLSAANARSGAWTLLMVTGITVMAFWSLRAAFM